MTTSPKQTTSTEPFFDAAEALKRLEFFPKYLRMPDGRFAGKPFNLLPWEQQIVSDLFGWKVYDPEQDDIVRWHTEAFVEIGAKNGKTSVGAGLALSIMCQDAEVNGYVFSIAEDKDQARIVFREAKGFCEGHPALRKRLKCGRDWIEHRNGNIWRVLPGDEAGNDGEKAIAVIIDEVHRIKQQGLYDVMKKSLAASRQGLLVSMTTAGDDRSALWRDLRDYAEKVEAGTVGNRRFYSVRFCADPSDPWDSEDTWRKANPSLGVTKTLAFMHELADKARVSPARRASFKRLHLNIPNQSDDALIDYEAWAACPSVLDADSLLGRPAWGGLDLSSTTDITALGLAIPDEDGETVDALWRFWMPEESAERRAREDGVPFTEWAKQGFITLTPGSAIDYGFIRRELNEVADAYDLRSVGYDPWNATQLCIELADDDGLPMVPVRQGFLTLGSPTKRLLSLVASGRLNHGGNPVAAWMAQNCVGKEDENENVKPVKRRSRGRIDGIVALINALCEWERTDPQSAEPSIRYL